MRARKYASGIVLESYSRSDRWTWRRVKSAWRGARIAQWRLVAVNVFSYVLVPLTFFGLLFARDIWRPWKLISIPIANHPIESIESVWFDGRLIP